MNNMYTILINEDHSLIHTVRKKIMRRSTGIDSIRFLVNPTYGDLDSKKANVVLELRTPITHTYKAIVLEASEELYRDKVEFIFPITIENTVEAGNLELTVNFSYLEQDSEGNFIERVRRIGKTFVEISEDVNWSDYIASSELDNIAAMMMMQQSLMEQQKEYVEMIAYKKADGIAKDEETNEIYLTSNGVKLGDGVIDEKCDSNDEEGVPIVDLNKSSDTPNPDDSDIIVI